MVGMSNECYETFLASADTLRVYRAGTLIYTSSVPGFAPLLDFLAEFGTAGEPVTLCDKVMGNAAACLAVMANAREVFSPYGSLHAVETLDEYGVIHHLGEVVPFIPGPDGTAIDPLEASTLDKEPEDVYEILRARIPA